MRLGIDLANYQHPTGDTLDWSAIANSGVVSWVAVLMGDGLHFANRYAVEDAAGSRSIGVETLAYFFGRPEQGDPEGQARLFAAQVGAAGPFHKLVGDMESGSSLGWDAVASWWRRFLAVQPLDLFYGPRGYMSALAPRLGIPDNQTWLADPGSAPSSSSYAAIQYGQGSIPGIQGTVDLDAIYYGDDMATLDLQDLAAIEGLLEAHLSKATPPNTYEQGSIHYIMRNRNFLDGMNDVILAHIQDMVTKLPISASPAGTPDPNLAQNIAAGVINEFAKRLTN